MSRVMMKIALRTTLLAMISVLLVVGCRNPTVIPEKSDDNYVRSISRISLRGTSHNDIRVSVSGSGFVILYRSKHFLITCNHLYSSFKEVNEVIYFKHRGEEISILHGDVIKSEKNDIAFVELKNYHGFYLLVSNKELKVNDTVISYGYSFGHHNIARLSGTYYGNVPVMMFGGQLWMFTDIGIKKGMSGGPVLNTSGYVVGINTIRANFEFSIHIPIDLALKDIDTYLK